jgi:hypothetical protein
MLNVKWIVVLALVAGMVCTGGCSSTPVKPPVVTPPVVTTPEDGGGEVTTTSAVPLWTTSRGQWLEDWQKEHKDQAGRFIWVVGTSQPVESRKFDQTAEKSASEQAEDELVRALGVTVDSLGMGGEAWSNETRELVIGIYKESLKTQMANHKINLENYAWHPYVVKDGATSSYLKKGLFRLDMQRLSENFRKDTVEDFAKNVKEQVKKNTQVQKELADHAKEATRKRMQELMGTADKK